MSRIKTLTINAFRGASQKLELTFEDKKPIALIFGENGTGKSTIVDAIDSVLNGEAGSLEERKLPKNCIPTIGAKPKDVKVEITTYDGKTKEATVPSKGTSKITCSGSDDCGHAYILRRSQLLKFIDSKPADRYTVMAKFVEVPGAQNSEDALREAAKEINDNYNSATHDLNQSREAVQKQWEAEGKPGQGCKEWADSVEKQDIASLESEVKSLKEFSGMGQNLKNALPTLVQAESDWGQAQKDWEEANKAITSQDQTGTQSELAELLGQAKAYLEKDASNNECPVCGNKINVRDVISRIETRLNDLDSLIKAITALKVKENKTRLAEDKKNDSMKQFLRLAQVALDLVVKPEYNSIRVDFNPKEFESLRRISDGADLEAARKVAEELNRRMQGMAKTIGKLLDDKVPQLNKLNNLKLMIQSIRENEEKSLELESLHKTLAKALDIVSACRKEYINAVLQAVADNVIRLYQAIHPDEKLGGFKLHLDDKFRNSLNLTGSFEGEDDLQPQAYYSESHLDSLGLCIFLALAEREAPESCMLMIDDVFNSSDQDHLKRTLELLHEEAKKFAQCIITTHYRQIMEMYRYQRLRQGEVQRVCLKPWNLDTGIRSDTVRLSCDDLKDALQASPLDRQVVASKAGVLLEQIFDHLTLTYQCKLPRKLYVEYTLGDLVSGISSKLKKDLRSGVVEKGKDKDSAQWRSLQPNIDEIGKMTIIRNMVGGHFNLEGCSFSDSEIREFAQQVLELHGLMVCQNPDCGELPSKTTGTHWKCSCGRLLLEPRVSPDAGKQAT